MPFDGNPAALRQSNIDGGNNRKPPKPPRKKDFWDDPGGSGDPRDRNLRQYLPEPKWLIDPAVLWRRMSELQDEMVSAGATVSSLRWWTVSGEFGRSKPGFRLVCVYGKAPC